MRKELSSDGNRTTACSVQTVNVLSYSLPLGFISYDEDTGVSNEMCDQEHVN